jgi:putative nucleotidyltransferase with HDIG domain
MRAAKFREPHLWAVEGILLAGMAAAAVFVTRPDEWRPVGLLALVIGLALGGEWFTVEALTGVVSASLAVMTLAMGLLGPVPAAICGMAAIGLHSAVAGRTAAEWLNNLVAFGVAAFAGAMLVRVLAGDVATHHPHGGQSLVFALVLLGGVIVLLALNFVLFSLDFVVRGGSSFTRMVREVFIPTLPGELAVAVIAILLVFGYRALGIPALVASLPVLLIFRQLSVALVRSEQRAEQLNARTRQLASFQWAVPSTFMEGLALREPQEMRHGAAVAKYAKAMAVELGCDEDDQEVIHLAGLLHDIGKFTWSDRMLHPEQLNDADWAVIRRHPQDGAMMMGKFDGFGPVADAILYHHERIDGSGYPAGLIGSEIPLASRIVAICSTYDTMTTRDTFGPPMAPDDAIAELRRIAGGQLDAELVETFIGLLERLGPTFAQDADYRSELAFENRVRKTAEPSEPGASSRTRAPAAMRLRRGA